MQEKVKKYRVVIFVRGSSMHYGPKTKNCLKSITYKKHALPVDQGPNDAPAAVSCASRRVPRRGLRRGFARFQHALVRADEFKPYRKAPQKAHVFQHFAGGL